MKKIYSLLVLIAVLFSSCLSIFAAPAETDFAAMEYVHYDPSHYYSLLEGVEKQCQDSANGSAVADMFRQALVCHRDMTTFYTLSYIRHCMDGENEYYNQEYAYSSETLLNMKAKLLSAGAALFASPCAAEAETAVGNEIATLFQNAEAPTEKLLTLMAKEQQLVQQYEIASLSQQAQRTETLGQIYVALLKVRDDIAAEHGYKSYAEYAYERVYERDYTPEMIQTLSAEATNAMSVCLNEFAELAADTDFHAVERYGASASTERMLSDVRAGLEALSPALTEAYDYMLKHGLYDLKYADKKLDMGYTTRLEAYGAPFMFNQPARSFYDVMTLVHEYGHYNSYYRQPALYGLTDIALDVAEIQSQALELLFMPQYRFLFDQLSAVRAAKIYTLTERLYTIFSGLAYNAFECAAAQLKNPTVEKLNRLFGECLEDFSLVSDSETMAALWVEIPHFFGSPMYYISYTMSVLPAFELWTLSLSDSSAATNAYLQLAQTQPSETYLETLKKIGLHSPFQNDYFKTIAAGCSSYFETLSKADYSKTDALLAQLPNDLSCFSAESAERLQKAAAAIERGLSWDKQNTVDQWTKELENALNALEEIPASATAAVVDAPDSASSAAVYAAVLGGACAFILVSALGILLCRKKLR